MHVWCPEKLLSNNLAEEQVEPPGQGEPGCGGMHISSEQVSPKGGPALPVIRCACSAAAWAYAAAVCPYARTVSAACPT